MVTDRSMRNVEGCRAMTIARRASATPTPMRIFLSTRSSFRRSGVQVSGVQVSGLLLPLLLDLLAEPLLLRARLRRELVAEVLGLEHGTDLDLGGAHAGVGHAAHPRDGVLHRLHLPEPEAGDELLRLGE